MRQIFSPPLAFSTTKEVYPARFCPKSNTLSPFGVVISLPSNTSCSVTNGDVWAIRFPLSKDISLALCHSPKPEPASQVSPSSRSVSFIGPFSQASQLQSVTSKGLSMSPSPIIAHRNEISSPYRFLTPSIPLHPLYQPSPSVTNISFSPHISVSVISYS